MNESTELDTALPAAPQKRDLLGQACFYLHFAIMLYILLGWAPPWRATQIFHLFFIPAVYLQWQFNRDTCVLNNAENWLRTGKWRDRENNPEEGAWIVTLARNVTHLDLTSALIDGLNYSVLVIVWLLALARLLHWM